MYRDEIIDEVWKNRDSYTSKHHHDLAEMVAELKIRQERPGCILVDRRDLKSAQFGIDKYHEYHNR